MKITTDINLEQVCNSGQCFRMTGIDGSPEQYEIIARDKRTVVTQAPGEIIFDCSDEEYESFWREYFDIDTDTDYDLIRSLADPSDNYLTEAIRFGHGIRILRQDLWEMIVTFLISQQNNIPRIRRCIENICREYGQLVISPQNGSDCHSGDEGRGIPRQNDSAFYAFPTPESLCNLPEDGLMPCNLGYRSKYVVRAAKSVAEGSLDLDAIRKMEYEPAREELLKIYGVGAKVADCICLFGLHHLEAFPIDTHIKQILEREYPPHPRQKSSGTSFPFDRYGEYAGVIQQYMFYYELNR